jgi:sortase A
MQDQRTRHRDSGGARLLNWTQWLLLAAGGAMLSCGVLIVADGAVAQWTARRSLEIATRVAAPVTSPGAVPTSRVVSRGSPVRGAAVAALSIPRIRLSAVVLHGSDTQTLRRGPGHLENTALPGESGNVVIAGHRDSFFRPLRSIAAGDDVFLDTSLGRVHYRVSSLRVVSAQDMSVVKPTRGSVLTLITCYPFSLIGHAPDRFVVRADRVEEPLGMPAAVNYELMAAPVIHPPAAAPAARGASPAGSADEGRVHDAAERFRLTYNARLFRRGETTAREAVTFQRCDIVIDADRATASCAASSRLPDEHDLTRWTLALERDGSGWGIRTVRID